MTLYIAGKINGNPNYKDHFEMAYWHIKKLKKDSKVIIPTVLPDELDYEQCMQICFAMIDVSDGIVFLPNWKESKGAVREYNYGKAKNKKLLDYNLNEIKEV